MKTTVKFLQFFFAVFCLTAQVLAQVCAIPGKDGVGPSSGVVNTYYPGVGTASAATSSIALGSSVGFASTPTVGDLFVIIQMQCANINTTNTTNYGAGNGTASGYTEPAGSCLAGRYQYLRAGPATTATSLDLTGSPLTGIYVQDALATTNRRTYQIVKVPQYSSTTLTGNVTAPYWNGTTGGVVILDATGTLNMGGFTIDVAGRGFRGGGGQVWNGTADAAITYVTATDAVTNLAGFKGEGIAGTPASVYNPVTNTVVATGTDYTGGGQGKGAPGNAGGGGDNWNGVRDNGGGGGGGNGAAGGLGGYGWSNGGWPAGVAQDLRGIGGATFAQNSVSRLVMGGGGGAGGNNNSAGILSSGAAGGGIVMIRAGTMTGAGAINVSGAAGQTQINNDSGGGGGAGGSVLVNTVSNAVGALTINATGGRGGDSDLINFINAGAHAGGGGGGGGVVFTDGGASTLTGGASGQTNIAGCPTTGVAPCDPSNGGGAGGLGATGGVGGDPSGGGGGSSNACLPILTVTKATTTPLISAAGATTATYTITVANTGAGAASGADIVDNTLPPGWTFASSSSVVFTPALSGTAFGGFIESATPGVPAVASNPGTIASLATNGAPVAAPIWGNLTIPGNGNVVLTYVVNVPAAAPVGTYHNPAGVKYLDPTRSTATREVTPVNNNTANRAGAQVGGTATTTYQTGSAAGGNIPGSNYSGLDGGAVGENVTLQADLRVVKTSSGTFVPASTAAGGTYTIAVSNVGRAVQGLTYAADQATPATVSTLLGAPYTVTDTLPTGMTLASPPTITGTEAASWACTGVAGDASFTCTRNAAASNIAAGNVTPVVMATISAPVRVTLASCPGPLDNTAVLSNAAIGEIVTTNNTSTVSTSMNCAASMVIAKTDNKATTSSGSANNYVITLTNNGPSAADGSVITDVVGAGLTCPGENAVTCTVLTGGAVCPVGPLTIANLTGAGITIATLPATGSIQLAYTCTTN